MKPRTALALVFAVSIAWVAFALAIIWPAPAHGQTAASAPASAASAADPVTYDSPCGAPAVGRSIRDERVIMGRFEGQHVNARGYWEVCTMPRPPRDCEAMPSPRWYSSGRWCEPLQPTIHAGDLGQVRRVNQADFRGGWRDYQCLQRPDGVKRWVPLRSTCK